MSFPMINPYTIILFGTKNNTYKYDGSDKTF